MGVWKVRDDRIRYTDTGAIGDDYTDRMNREYTWMAKAYDAFMFVFPVWKVWIKKVIPHIEGEDILEVSFGSGYLMTRYGREEKYNITGIDYNEKMVEITRKKMAAKKIGAKVLKANVENLPFADGTFDTVINTMALTGYPDGDRALSEMKRVLRPGGRLLIVDFDYPRDRNRCGVLFVRLMEAFGDIMKDINGLLRKQDLDYRDKPVGGCGSVHLYVCRKKAERGMTGSE